MSAIPGFIGGAYAGANPVSAFETCVNLYPSAVETAGGMAPAELLPTPGYSLVTTAAQSECRAAFTTGPISGAPNGRTFFIYGTKLYEFSSPTLTERGTVVDNNEPAYISFNGAELLIVAGGSAYSYDLATNTLASEITGGCVQGGVVDGYGVVLVRDSTGSYIRRSDLFDMTTWDPLEFAGRSIQSDEWLAMLVDPYGYITLLGSKTGESWSNVGTSASTFPFAPDRSGLIEEGIAAPHTFRQAGKHKVWLSHNANGGYQVLAAQGFQVRRISTYGIERLIADLGSVNDGSFAETYEDGGHAFYVLTFPTSGLTVVYDFATGLWHRRAQFTAGSFDAWVPAFHVFFRAAQEHYFGARNSGKLFKLDNALATEDSETVVREREFSPGGNLNQLVFYDCLEVIAQSGVGLTEGSSSAADADPKFSLYVSDDYGRTFGSAIEASVGAGTVYEQRAQWWGLGAAHGRRYRLQMSAAVPWRLTAATQKVRMGGPLEAA